jgi:hypothetical protein
VEFLKQLHLSVHNGLEFHYFVALWHQFAHLIVNGRLGPLDQGFLSTSAHRRGVNRCRCESCCSSTFRLRRLRLRRPPLLRRTDPGAVLAVVAAELGRQELKLQPPSVTAMGLAKAMVWERVMA